MPNTTLDKAIAAVPKFRDRISLFTKKLRLAQYADGSIYDYRLKIAQAVLFFKKLPDEFTQTDIDYYLSTLLDKNRCSLSFFKHTVFGLQAYYKVMGLKQPGGLVLPPVRKPKKLPRVLSQEQIARLLRNCSLYDKTLLAIIYDCALRVGEACRLRWDDICFDRKKLFVFQGKGRKDRYVPISDQMLVVLKAYSHLATGMHCATYRSSSMCRPCRKKGQRSHILRSVRRMVGRLEYARNAIASVSS